MNSITPMTGLLMSKKYFALMNNLPTFSLFFYSTHQPFQIPKKLPNNTSSIRCSSLNDPPGPEFPIFHGALASREFPSNLLLCRRTPLSPY